MMAVECVKLHLMWSAVSLSVCVRACVHAWDVCMAVTTVNSAQYSDWAGFLASLQTHQPPIRMMVYLNPMLRNLSSIPGLAHYYFQEAAAKGYFVHNADGSVFISYAGAGLIDFTNPAAWSWYKSLIQNNVLRYGTAMAGWMADFGENLPPQAKLYDGTDAASRHNEFPLLWQRLNAEAIAELNRTNDVVYFCRSASLGSQRFTPLFWLGDQLTTWDHFDGLQSAIMGMLHAGLSGYTMTHSDTGGYTGLDQSLGAFGHLKYNRTKELFLRWCEFSAFTAAYRTHAGNIPDNNVQFWTDADTMNQFARFAKVYASLDQYRQVLMPDVTERGWPLARPMFLHFPDDPVTWTLGLQYLLGPDLLVAPVTTEGDVSVRVYFPNVALARWVAVFDPAHTVYASGWKTVPAPIGQPAVFIREGTQTTVSILAALRGASVVS